jgi:hypothetical protein
VRITKVVGFFSMNPTILVLQFSEFSMIFYTFYKILQSCNTIEDGILHRNPCKESRLCNWVPRPWEAARLRPIPASRRRSRPGKRWGVTVGSPRVDGWSELGRRGCRRGEPTAAGSGCRGGSGKTARRTQAWTTHDPGRCTGV